ncbi:MAG: metal ABC transporter substrate-binding protein [Deinococcales bacterium]
MKISHIALLSGFALLVVSSAAAQSKPKKVVATTFTILADMARNVAGNKAIINSITRVGAEIHGYKPTPSDIAKTQKANLVLYNGLNLERWFERFTRQLKNVPRALLTEGITPINIADADYKGKPNPHAWMSPKNGLVYIENIRKALVRIDPENASSYNANAKSYAASLSAIDQKLKARLSSLPTNARALVTCEGAFSYAARDYGLREFYLWAVNSDEQGTPRQIRNTIDVVRKNKIPAVFCESTVQPDTMQQVAKEAGSRFAGLLYADSLSAANGPVPTYLRLLEHFAETVTKGLGNAR